MGIIMGWGEFADKIVGPLGDLYSKFFRKSEDFFCCNSCIVLVDVWCRQEQAGARRDEIIVRLRSARTKSPKIPIHAYMLSLVYFKLAGNKDAALDQVGQFLELIPKNNQELHSLGSMLQSDINKLQSSVA